MASDKKSFVPIEGDFSITGGMLETNIGEIKMYAYFGSWSYLYSDESKKIEIGWGPNLTKGKVIFSSKDYDSMESGNLGYYVKNFYESQPFDYLGKYVLINLDSAKGHHLAVPMIIPIAKFPRFGPGSLLRLVKGDVFNANTDLKGKDFYIYEEAALTVLSNATRAYRIEILEGKKLVIPYYEGGHYYGDKGIQGIPQNNPPASLEKNITLGKAYFNAFSSFYQIY